MDGLLRACALALILCSLGLPVDTNPFWVEPQNTNAALGETVVLPCILKNTTLSHCRVFWYRSDAQVYISHDEDISNRLEPEVRERYSILGNSSSGDFSLQIRDVAIADAGEYKCACFSRLHSDNYMSPPAAIFIVVRPPEEYPICSIREGSGTLMVGQKVSFLCESSGGRPPVALQWKRGSENIIADFTFNPHSISVYRKTLTLEDSEAILTCVASGLAMQHHQNCSVGPLSVVSPLRIQTQTMFAKHGTRRDPRVVFTCNSNVNQTGMSSVYNYTWYANTVRITTDSKGFALGNGGMSVQVTDLSLFSKSIHIVCEAHGAVGSLGNVSTFLDMDSIPSFTTIPRNDHPKTESPIKGIVSISGNKYFDIRPFIYLLIGAFVLMTTLIAIVVCIPRTCCHPKSSSRLRRRDSQFTTMHYVQQPTGSAAHAIAHQESLNLYESTADSDTESTRQSVVMAAPAAPSLTPQQQQQQVQATLHVVVHSGNNPVNQHQTMLQASSGTLVDDEGAIYQELPTPPPPPPPHSSRTLKLHPPLTSSASTTLRTQTWGHSSFKNNPFAYEHTHPDLMHYDHLGGCYVHTLPMKPSKPTVHQKYLYTPQYAQLNKFHTGAVESMYENIPLHHGRTMSMTRTGWTGY